MTEVYKYEMIDDLEYDTTPPCKGNAWNPHNNHEFNISVWTEDNRVNTFRARIPRHRIGEVGVAMAQWCANEHNEIEKLIAEVGEQKVRDMARILRFMNRNYSLDRFLQPDSPANDDPLAPRTIHTT